MTRSGNYQKWEKYAKNLLKSNKIDSACRLVTFRLTLHHTLELLGEKRSGKMLDIGCGFGELTILLAQNTNFEITGFDISKRAIEIAKVNVKKAGLENRIKIEEGDIYNLKYPDSYFDAAVSFGLASAATYSGVQADVARVLKPGGILICDFINCLSLYKFFYTLKRALINKKYPYYLTLSGIKQEFKKAGLIFKQQRFFNTYPPIYLVKFPQLFLAFENTLGKLSRNFLSRARLVCFQK